MWALLVAGADPAIGQERVTVTADLIWYGDNTEFRNPFREGDTLLGTAARVGAEIELGPRVRVQLGAFGNVRWGSSEAFDSARPVIALDIRGDRSRFVFGTLPPPPVLTAIGPDRTGPHGLLPPLQRETLAFERPYEAGLLWGHRGAWFEQEAWLNWQRLNTPEHRERFDAGLVGRLRATARLAIPLHFHIVHEGGQLHASGPVADSYAAATGVEMAFPAGGLGRGTVEALGLASRHVPDRARANASRSGAALFTRLAFERGVSRAHLIVWRADDFIKVEGDNNYQSLRRNGVRYGGIRDYSEIGLTRTFRPDPRVTLEASARLHRVERHYEYSYRIVAVTSWRVPIRAKRDARP
jgi:hypothetical protein